MINLYVVTNFYIRIEMDASFNYFLKSYFCLISNTQRLIWTCWITWINIPRIHLVREKSQDSVALSSSRRSRGQPV